MAPVSRIGRSILMIFIATLSVSRLFICVRLLSCIGVGYHFCRHVLYPKLRRSMPQAWTPASLRWGVSLLFNAATASTLFHRPPLPEVSTRAAYLAVANLTSLFRTNAESYGFMHRATGFMAVIQATIHVIIVFRQIDFDPSDMIQFHGLAGGCFILCLLFLPMVRRRVYAVFLLTHLACAVGSLISIWRHVHAVSGHFPKLIVICGVVLIVNMLRRGLRRGL